MVKPDEAGGENMVKPDEAGGENMVKPDEAGGEDMVKPDEAGGEDMEPESIEKQLSNLTRKQRKIYDMHLELFDAIFEHDDLKHVDPDILDILLIEQKAYLIAQLQDTGAHEYNRMTIKGCQESVDRAINEDLDKLVQVIVSTVKDLESVKA